MFKSCAAILLGPLLTLSAASTEHWVGTWATAVVTRPQAPRPAPVEQPAPPANPAPGTQPAGLPAAFSLNNQTLREIVHVSVSGSRVRVVLSNEFGTAPLTIGAASIALRDKDAKIAANSSRALAFSRRPSVHRGRRQDDERSSGRNVPPVSDQCN